MSLAGAAALVRGACSIAVLTGAGISTASGIPDFRGPNGRWRVDPEAEKISTLSHYLHDPVVRAKAWKARAARPFWEAAPNPGHLALVDLERSGRLAGLITQNTDGLHLAAGSSPELVHEVHGNARTWRCEDCRATGPMLEVVQRVWDGETDPRCACGGIIRATVILFEEALEAEVLQAAADAVAAADLVLAVGTTLGVYPVASLVPWAVERGTPLVILNNQPTQYDHLASAIASQPISEALPTVCGSHGLSGRLATNDGSQPSTL